MKLSEEQAKIYYTAAEARKALDIDEEAFQYWGRSKKIARIYLPERKQAVYSRKEIDKIAKRTEIAMIAEQPEGIEFRKATKNDLETEYNLSHLIFGKGAHTLETRKHFLEQNPDVDYHLYDHEKLVAFIQVIPFDQKTIERFISGQERGWEIDPKKIKQFIPGEPMECIIMEMATTPTVPPAQRTAYGSLLLSNISDTFTVWGDRGIIITKLYATSSTQTGIRILKNANFKVIKDLGRGRLAFELDIVNSNAKIFRDYKEAIKEWDEKTLKRTK
jgi:hypothetical protein